jgi:ABC-2 type transport system permease protein
VILMVVGFALGGLRDLGRGLLGQGRGRRAHGSVFLGGEWGLAWRLTRGPILGWGIAIFVMAAAFGSVMGQMEDFIMSNPLYQAMIGVGADATDIVAPLLVTLMLITATMAAIPVLTTAHKLASEERLGRMDYLLGKTVSRWRLFLGYGILVVLVAVAMQLLAAVGYWMVAATIMTDPLPASMVFKIALNAVPALIVVGGLAFFLVGWAKQLTWINWGYLGLSFLMVYVGGMLNLPRWAMRITPFGMLQRWPQEDFSLILWLGMIAVGAVLAVLGATAYRRRDIIN